MNISDKVNTARQEYYMQLVPTISKYWQTNKGNKNYFVKECKVSGIDPERYIHIADNFRENEAILACVIFTIRNCKDGRFKEYLRNLLEVEI